MYVDQAITRVIRIDENGRRFVLHTIMWGCKYTGVKTLNRLDLAENQLKQAELLKQAWEQNGIGSSYLGTSKIVIEQEDRRSRSRAVGPHQSSPRVRSDDKLGQILWENLVPRIPSAGGDPN